MPPRRHLRDVCSIGTLSDSGDSPYSDEAHVYAASVRCRFTRNSTKEVIDGAQVASTDVTIFLPSSASIEESSRIQLSRRNGATLSSPEYFEVIGAPWFTRGNRQIVVNCKSVAGGAV